MEFVNTNFPCHVVLALGVRFFLFRNKSLSLSLSLSRSLSPPPPPPAPLSFSVCYSIFTNCFDVRQNVSQTRYFELYKSDNFKALQNYPLNPHLPYTFVSLRLCNTKALSGRAPKRWTCVDMLLHTGHSMASTPGTVSFKQG